MIFNCLLTVILTVTSQISGSGPTMGWSSWNTYRVHISDSLIISQADAMVKRGLAEAGYRYINIDDGYFGGRDASGRLKIHPERFPSGLRPVVDHIHSLGLKAGIYSDAGGSTCGNFWDNDSIARGVGLYNHDSEDAELFFNELGFDFIKVDFCGGDASQNHEGMQLNERERYTAIRDAIRNTGRKDVRLNVCRWNYPGTWVDSVGFSWRISHDISADWRSVKNIIQQNLPLSAYCRNGGFNDMDMLEVGRGLSPDEDATHFALWCIMSSPLLIGCDLTKIDDSTLSLLTNPELIAINQDTLHLQAYPAAYIDGCFVVVKDIETLYGNRRVFAVYNPTDYNKEINLGFESLDMAGDICLRELIGRKDAGICRDSISINLPPHGTRVYVATADERLNRRIYEAETGYISCYSEIDETDKPIGRYVFDSNCSGGFRVENLGFGPENDLIWDNVYMPEESFARLSIKYLKAKDTAFTVTVNGTDIKTLTPENDSDCSSLNIRLQKGLNTIRLYNPVAAMPQIDCITVDKIN